SCSSGGKTKTTDASSTTVEQCSGPSVAQGNESATSGHRNTSKSDCAGNIGKKSPPAPQD
ncbi:unnamed protein product, partial [Amoebophrya sp. A120]